MFIYLPIRPVFSDVIMEIPMKDLLKEQYCFGWDQQNGFNHHHQVSPRVTNHQAKASNHNFLTTQTIVSIKKCYVKSKPSWLGHDTEIIGSAGRQTYRTIVVINAPRGET